MFSFGTFVGIMFGIILILILGISYTIRTQKSTSTTLLILIITLGVTLLVVLNDNKFKTSQSNFDWVVQQKALLKDKKRQSEIDQMTTKGFLTLREYNDVKSELNPKRLSK